MGNSVNPLLNTVKDCSEWKMLKKRDDLRRKKSMKKSVKKVEAGLFTEQLKSVANNDIKIVDGKKERIRCHYVNDLLNPVENIFQWNMFKKNRIEFEMTIDENISNTLEGEDGEFEGRSNRSP
ncbi:hypothetical protein DCAR_0209606 [Daucus carota subsp. sativus]|uniref:Uncharacterized protein n=1 Tax=Daucus carota subsp. sativus TaxID=79200 RepID=A0A166FE06_DAUCS|nr:hypothetical protein DCAR_0209606 [Daucus carota subsp. sativus]